MSGTPVSEFIHLVNDTMNSLEKTIQKEFDILYKRLIPLWKQECTAHVTPYVLSLVGLTNVGKSTLAEALLGFPVAPHKNGPATSIPVEYIYDQHWRMEVLTRHFEPEEIEFENAESLAQALKKRVVGIDAATAHSIAWVTVRGPMNLLKGGLTLADTPGFGSIQKDDDNIHQHKLEEFITARVHRVYFCVAAGDNSSISDDEKNFYNKINHLCNHIVVTKWESDENATQEYVDKFQPLFPGAKFIFVNAKNALKGKKSDLDVIKKSNIKTLQSIITHYRTPEGRRRMVLKDLSNLWKNFHRHLVTVYGLSEIPWRQDSLRRFYSACKAEEELWPISIDIERIMK
ncbi:MAG TPA: dynamin family protein [Paludibacter sp.]|nr:MAG: GTPase Era [Bacteroidetes bacterium ADurb.Bin174]HQB28290.1 dynamin family protein [Paludibacter sp.]